MNEMSGTPQIETWDNPGGTETAMRYIASTLERERIVADFGDHPVLVLRNHGLIATGRSAAEMFSNMFCPERACEIQVAATSSGRPLRMVDEKVAAHVHRQYVQMNEEDGDLALEWDAHLRSIEGLGTDYRA